MSKKEHSLPYFCLHCYAHSWKNCYGENPCTPVRLLTRKFPLTKEAHEAMIILQNLYAKVSFEEKESWNKKRVRREKRNEI